MLTSYFHQKHHRETMLWGDCLKWEVIVSDKSILADMWCKDKICCWSCWQHSSVQQDGSDIRLLLKINCYNFGDPATVQLSTPSSQQFNMLHMWITWQIIHKSSQKMSRKWKIFPKWHHPTTSPKPKDVRKDQDKLQIFTFTIRNQKVFDLLGWKMSKTIHWLLK